LNDSNFSSLVKEFTRTIETPTVSAPGDLFWDSEEHVTGLTDSDLDFEDPAMTESWKLLGRKKKLGVQ
jgi:hypothetical protein